MVLLEAHLSRVATSPDAESEQIQRIATGDENALRELYAACGQRLYAYALRITGDPAAAEEALQESLVAVWQGARSFRRQGRAISWLLGIVHHKALNTLRGRPLLPLDEEENEPPGELPPPDELAAASERRRLLHAGLRQLSAEHRAVLELVFYQGLSMEETAAVTGCPVGTVKSRLNAAKASLRGVLSRQGFNEEDLL